MAKRSRPILIGVGGGSGSGKTYLAHKVGELAGWDHVGVLSMDQYFTSRNLSHKQAKDINFDHPAHLDFRLMMQHLKQLRAGKAVMTPRYDFQRMVQEPEAIEIPPSQVILVEGLFVLAEPAVKLLDLSCFLDVDPDQRLLGRILRDLKERHATIESIVDRYQRFVRPSYHIFVGPTKQNADVIVDFTYRRAFFTQLLAGLIVDYVHGGFDIKSFVEEIRSESYHLGFRPQEGMMPLTADIFKLAKAYPESVAPAEHLAMNRAELQLDEIPVESD